MLDLTNKQRNVVEQAYAALKEQLKSFGLSGPPTLSDPEGGAFKNDPIAQETLRTWRREYGRLYNLRHPGRMAETCLRSYHRYPERHAERARRRREAHSLEEIKELDHRNYEARKEYYKAYSREHGHDYYEAHLEEFRTYGQKYRKEHPEKVLKHLRHRRAVKAGADGSHTIEEFKKLCEEFDYRCAYCSGSQEEMGELTEDHMTPISRGGSDFIDNIIPACQSCNSSKQDKTAEEFLNLPEEVSNAVPY